MYQEYASVENVEAGVSELRSVAIEASNMGAAVGYARAIVDGIKIVIASYVDTIEYYAVDNFGEERYTVDMGEFVYHLESALLQ